MPEEKPTLDHEHLPTRLGTDFIAKFYRLLKGTTIYDRKNVIIDRLTQECLQVINSIIESEGHLFLKIVRDNFFFNNIRIIVKADKYAVFKAFWQEMRRRWIGEVEFFKDEDIYIDSEDQKKYSKEVYFKSIGLVKEVVESINQQKALNIRKAKRLMQNAVNAIMQDDCTLLGLANIKNYDEYTFNHSVNVAIYAIALGQRSE